MSRFPGAKAMRIPLLGVIGSLFATTLSLPAGAEDASVWFNKAVQYDLNGTGDTTLAFAWYRRAADAGMPEAEFNVGVMLDSGRGVRADLAEAAIWYARAATHGNHRAAYNLGLLYEDGQGVPQNLDLAHAYFAASDLAAARGHLSDRPQVSHDAALSAPALLAPRPNTSISPMMDGIEFVWTSQMQPEPMQYFVELRALDGSGSTEVFTGSTDMASLFAPLPAIHGDYAWRVTAVGRKEGRYIASPWVRFSTAPSQSAAQ